MRLKRTTVALIVAAAVTTGAVAAQGSTGGHVAIQVPSYATFESAASRDRAIPHPKRGQSVLLLDTGEVLYYYGSVYGWNKPWNTPWGVVGSATLGTSVPAQINPATDYSLINWGASGLVAPFHAYPNRIYEVELRAQVYTTQGVDNLVQVLAAYFPANTVHLMSGSWQQFTQRPQVNGYVENVASATGAILSLTVARRFGPNENNTLPVGDGEFAIGAVQSVGTGAFIWSDYRFDTSITVRDLGPSGNPFTS